jgi:hypothetical protein
LIDIITRVVKAGASRNEFFGLFSLGVTLDHVIGLVLMYHSAPKASHQDFSTFNGESSLYASCHGLLHRLCLRACWMHVILAICTRQGSTTLHAGYGAREGFTSALGDRQKQGTGKTALCIVGSLRTFGLPQVGHSFAKNIINSIGTENLDTFAVISFSDKRRVSCPDEEAVSSNLKIINARSVKFVYDSSCKSYRQHTGRGHCVDDNSFLQLSWIDYCFQLAVDSPASYTHFIRMRPDSYMLQPLPPLHTLVMPDAVTTARRNEDTANDMFFMFNASHFDFKGSPESFMFRGVKLVISAEIKVCLVRSPEKAHRERIIHPPRKAFLPQLQCYHFPGSQDPIALESFNALPDDVIGVSKVQCVFPWRDQVSARGEKERSNLLELQQLVHQLGLHG